MLLSKLKFLWLLKKNLKFNIHYFGLKNGLKLPILLNNNVRIKKCKGEIEIDMPLRKGMILIGFTTTHASSIKEHCIWNVEGKIFFKGTATLGSGSKISVGPKATLRIGNSFEITANSTIACYHNTQIGDNCLFSWDILTMDTDSHNVYDQNNKIINPDSPILIGDRVWIGCRTLILKGTIIPNDTIVAAGSILNRKFLDSNTLIAGNTANTKKYNIHWFVAK